MSLFGCPELVVAAESRPNIVFFLVDDLGYSDLGCFGSKFYETPHIDRLAAGGMKLTNAYAACPVCSPTRVSLLTGRYPARMQTTNWFGAPQPDEWRRNTPLVPPRYVDHIEHSQTTLAEALRAGGYATFFAGKWHLGPEGSWPEDHGFEINKGGCEWGSPKSHGGGGYFSPYNNPRLENGPKGEHLTARLAEETCRFIEAHTRNQSDKPFLAYLSFYTVHTPLQAPKEVTAKYQAKQDRLGDVVADRWGRDGESEVRLVQNHPVYSAMVESLDTAVGRVLDALKRAGVANNTVVVFTSDNGGLSTAEGSPTSNLPLRAGKGWMYEGGIREPTIVRWPGVTQPGSESDTLVTSPDFYPTLLEAAKLPAAPEQHLDGVSFTAALRGESVSRGPVFWHYPHYGNQGGRPGAAVRDGRWKLIKWYGEEPLELYDVESDISETTNLAITHPKEVVRLKHLLDDWLAEVGALLPTKNPSYQPE